jgi:hypothetical protein
LEAVGELNEEEPGYAFAVLTTIESILESPGVVVAAQIRRAKDELMADMKASGVEYEERMERLSEVEGPKPEKERLYESFDRFRVHHPWVGSDNVRPKSIVREMLEQAMTFREFVNHYGLKRSEGVVLRYLSDVYKALVQNVPENAKSDEVYDIIEWLGAVVRQVDSSLIDEWERLTNPESVDGSMPVRPPTRTDVTTDRRGFRVLLRNEAFRWVLMLARRDYDGLAECTDPGRLAEEERRPTPALSADELGSTAEAYWTDHVEVLTGPDARGPEFFQLDDDWSGSQAAIRQVVRDPAGYDEWAFRGFVDLDRSRLQGKAIVVLVGFDEPS